MSLGTEEGRGPRGPVAVSGGYGGGGGGASGWGQWRAWGIFFWVGRRRERGLQARFAAAGQLWEASLVATRCLLRVSEQHGVRHGYQRNLEAGSILC